jgi:hypothetical protein
MSSTRHPSSAPFTQGVFYVVTGLWPIIHLRSFEKFTGRKQQREGLLAQSMGGLIAAVGVALIAGSLEERPSRALKWLGMGSAIALGVADLVFARRGLVRHTSETKSYFADAAAEGAAIAGWIIAKPRAFN